MHKFTTNNIFKIWEDNKRDEMREKFHLLVEVVERLPQKWSCVGREAESIHHEITVTQVHGRIWTWERKTVHL